MFGRRNTTQATASNPVNKLVTYALIAFLVFLMYTNQTKPKPAAPLPASINYTPVELGNYVRVKNLISGDEGYHNITADMKTLKFSLTAEDIQQLKTSGKSNIPVLEVEVNTTKTTNLFAPR